MAPGTISAIHPEYLRPEPILSESTPRGSIVKKVRPFLLGGGALVLLMSLRVELALSSLRTEMATLNDHTTKVFREYDALHQVIVERLKRHGEVIKTVGGERSPGEPRYGEVVVPRANVRAEAQESGTILMTVPKGARLLIEEDSGEWIKVMTPLGTSGFIAREVFKETP